MDLQAKQIACLFPSVNPTHFLLFVIDTMIITQPLLRNYSPVTNTGTGEIDCL